MAASMGEVMSVVYDRPRRRRRAAEYAMDQATVGPADFEGWSRMSFEGFNALVGPYYWRRDALDAVQVAFRAQSRHLNNLGAVHGGCLMALADSALFSICRSALGDGHGVTVSLGGDFIGSAHAGEIIQATGEVTRAGGSLVFARGAITADGRPAVAFSGIIKRIRPR